MGKQLNFPPSRLDTNATIQVNGIRTLVAGLIWATLFTGGWLILTLPLVLTGQKQMNWVNLLIALPGIARSGFSMPFLFLVIALILDVLMKPFNDVKILKIIFGLLLPSADVATALVMLVADPIVYILWRLHPPLIPVQRYNWIMFCHYVRVEGPAGGNQT